MMPTYRAASPIPRYRPWLNPAAPDPNNPGLHPAPVAADQLSNTAPQDCTVSSAVQRSGGPGLMNTQDVANLFGITERSVRNWRRKGLLVGIRITCRSVYYRVADIEKLLSKSVL